MNKKQKRRQRRNDLIYGVVLFLLWLSRFIPRTLGLRLTAGIGSVVHRFSDRDRERALANLRRIYGETEPASWIRTTSCRVFQNLAMDYFDTLHFWRCSDQAFRRNIFMENREAFLESYNQGRGVVAMVAHLGCFEIIPQYFNRHGIKGFTVGQEVFDPRLDELIRSIRSGPYVEYMHRTGSAREIIRYLKEGRAFGALIDQDTRLEGVFTHFLGDLAYTPSAPMRLAMRLDVPVVVITTARMRDNTHRIFVDGPIEREDTGNFDRDLVINIEKVNEVISSRIRQYPDQWVWMHRRWLHRPEDPEYRNVLNVNNFFPAETNMER